MASQPDQDYSSHRSIDRELYVLAFAFLLATLLGICGVHMLDTDLGPMLLTVAFLAQAVGFFWLILKLRRYALIVQDRVIRLEMQVRLARVLPKEQGERAKALKLSQLIGLRYASDGELPELVEKALADPSLTSDALKRMVKHWQADHQRV